MAEPFLEEIYRESKLLFDLKQLVEFIRLGQPLALKRKFNEISGHLQESCERYARSDRQSANELWGCLLELTTKTGGEYDYVRMGDCLEEKIIPGFQAYLSQWGNICVDDGQGFCLKSSKSGFLTVQLTENGRYLHSTLDPMWEAYLMAKQLYRIQTTNYVFWGCGLGYIPYQIYLYSNGSANIKVFEPDPRMVQYGLDYGVLGWIPQDHLEVFVSEDIMPFVESTAHSDTAFYIHEPSFPMVRADQRQFVTGVLIDEKTKRTFEKNFRIHAWQNSRSVRRMISDFDKSRMKKEMIVVAAGPSLDEDMDYLREMQGEKSIIAVGTVFSKLVKGGIRPDIVTILDSYPSTLKQIDGLYGQDVPLLLGEAAYWEIARKYRGEKYLVFTDPALELPQEYTGKKIEYIKCGGTVTDLAIREALYFGAASIELIGVDLAFPGNVSHAKDTPERTRMDTGTMVLADSVSGGQVYTTNVMCGYREGIEKIIRENPDVKFVNRSKIGARIQGTKE